MPGAMMTRRVIPCVDPAGRQVLELASREALSDEVAVLLLVDFAPSSVLWGWSRLVRGTNALRHCRGLRFAKVLGSGVEGGFGLKPSTSRQGLFALFSDETAADAFIHDSEVMSGYRKRTQEFCVIKLRAYSARGSWDGRRFPLSSWTPVCGPVAALTRASIHARKAPAFWRYAPAAQESLESAPGCQLAVGLGEAPVLRQATFSIWDSLGEMDAYARSGAHLEAIRAAQTHQFFSESMFVRFVPLSLQGIWKGRHFAQKHHVTCAG